MPHFASDANFFATILLTDREWLIKEMERCVFNFMGVMVSSSQVRCNTDASQVNYLHTVLRLLVDRYGRGGLTQEESERLLEDYHGPPLTE